MTPIAEERIPASAPPPPESSAAANVVRSAGMMSVATMLSRITGLVREFTMAQLFGAGLTMDAFNTAFRLPNLTRDLFAEGALSAAFVPTFTEYLNNKSREEAAKLANLVATAVIMVVGGICILGVIFAPWLVNLAASGFQYEPGKSELATHLARIMFPFLLLVALAAQAMGILNSCNQFGIPALASSLFNIFSVASGLLLGYGLGPSLGISHIDGMAWGVLIGGLCQLLGQVPSLVSKGFVFRPAIDWQDPGLRHIIKLMGPAVLGGAAVQINILINTDFATHIIDPVRGGNGSVSWLSYAFRFFQLPLGLFGVAIASATTPAISRSLSSGNTDEFRRTLSRSLGVVFLLTVPSSIGLVVLGRDMIAAIFQGGKFDAYDSSQTALALSCYAVGLAGYAGAKILNPAFYALRDSRTPMMISIGSIVVNFIAAYLSVHYTHLGHAGLALSTTCVAMFSFVVLFGVLRLRIGGLHGRDLASSVAKISVASLFMGIVIAMLHLAIERWFGVSKMVSALTLAICIPIGASVFYMVCALFRVSELELAVSGLAAPLKRWVLPRRGTLK